MSYVTEPMLAMHAYTVYEGGDATLFSYAKHINNSFLTEKEFDYLMSSDVDLQEFRELKFMLACFILLALEVEI